MTNIITLKQGFDKSAKENIILTNEKLLNDVFNTLGVNSLIVNVERLGKFHNSRSKPKTIMVELSNEWEKNEQFQCTNFTSNNEIGSIQAKPMPEKEAIANSN